MVMWAVYVKFQSDYRPWLKISKFRSYLDFKLKSKGRWNKVINSLGRESYTGAIIWRFHLCGMLTVSKF